MANRGQQINGWRLNLVVERVQCQRTRSPTFKCHSYTNDPHLSTEGLKKGDRGWMLEDFAVALSSRQRRTKGEPDFFLPLFVPPPPLLLLPWLGTRRRGGVNKEARGSERQTLLIRDEKANPRLSPASCVVCGIGIRCAAM